MIGETKTEIYKLLPNHLYPKTLLIHAGTSEEELINELKKNGFEYPFVVKPDRGEKGLLFRRVETRDQLLHYHNKVFFPYLVQAFSNYPVEVSIFYTRMPDDEKGIISGFFRKEPLQVKGTGTDTLEALVSQSPKALKWKEELYIRHTENWQQILPKGKIYILSYAANHNQGATFSDLKHLITPAFTAKFDELSSQANDLYYGRYDIMCNSVNDLLNWKNFTILEFNGAGAEPNHIYDTGYSLAAAYKELLWHWKRLYDISWYNRKNGTTPWPYKKGKYFMRESKIFFEKMKCLDKELGF